MGTGQATCMVAVKQMASKKQEKQYNVKTWCELTVQNPSHAARRNWSRVVSSNAAQSGWEVQPACWGSKPHRGAAQCCSGALELWPPDIIEGVK